MRTIVILAALLVASLIAIALLWRRARFWKLIAQESQASSTYWRRLYEGQLCGDNIGYSGYSGHRSSVSVLREGPSRWFDVEREARGGG